MTRCCVVRFSRRWLHWLSLQPRSWRPLKAAGKSDGPDSKNISKANTSGTEKAGDAKAQITSPMDKIRRLRAIVGEGRPPLRPEDAQAPTSGRPIDRNFLTAMWLLTISDSLQDELKMTEKQRTQVAKISEQLDATIWQIAQDMGPSNPGRTEEERQAVSTELKTRSLDIADKTDAAYRAVVKPAQVTRLEQVVLQIKGPLAVAEPAVAEAILLEPDQLQQIEQILTRMRAGQGPPVVTSPRHSAPTPRPHPSARQWARAGSSGQGRSTSGRGRRRAANGGHRPRRPLPRKSLRTTMRTDSAAPKGRDIGRQGRASEELPGASQPATPEQIARFRPAAQRRSAGNNEALREKAIQEVSKVLTSSYRRTRSIGCSASEFRIFPRSYQNRKWRWASVLAAPGIPIALRKALPSSAGCWAHVPPFPGKEGNCIVALNAAPIQSTSWR